MIWQSTSILWSTSYFNFQSSTVLVYGSGPKVIALGLGSSVNKYSLSIGAVVRAECNVFCSGCCEDLLNDGQSSAMIDHSVYQHLKSLEGSIYVF